MTIEKLADVKKQPIQSTHKFRFQVSILIALPLLPLNDKDGIHLTSDRFDIAIITQSGFIFIPEILGGEN